MKKIFPLFLLPSLISIITTAQPDSVRYHDGDFESQYGAGGAYPGTDYMQCVVRFTPPYYPARLTGIRAYFRNALNPAPFRFVVYSDASASASGPPTSSIYISPSPITNPSSGGMPDTAYNYFVDLTSSNIIINAGDVYAGATQYSQINGFFGIAIDTNSNTSLYNRNWISTSQGAPGSWMQMVNWTFIPGEWGVTAFFTSITTSIVKEGTSENNFSIYPNPTCDELFISIAAGEKQVRIILTDESGREISLPGKSEFNLGDKKIIHADVSRLSKGIYYCRMISAASVSVTKVVIY